MWSAYTVRAASASMEQATDRFRAHRTGPPTSAPRGRQHWQSPCCPGLCALSILTRATVRGKTGVAASRSGSPPSSSHLGSGKHAWRPAATTPHRARARQLTCVWGPPSPRRGSAREFMHENETWPSANSARCAPQTIRYDLGLSTCPPSPTSRISINRLSTTHGCTSPRGPLQPATASEQFRGCTACTPGAPASPRRRANRRIAPTAQSRRTPS
ncbi:hypothetical protein C2E23DRAFT_808298 [Lenzites betulinus]|nr:hypothetical protein C2E23DRAFT_808298 [Lenzites betulinus]